MPNIVITEGLDTPWELQNTESNITAATDLTSINLTNQTVGTLAYTASQLFSSLETEKNNLDNIVDAIELINEEIALFPERIAKWDGISDTFEKTDLSAIPNPIRARVIGISDSLSNADLSQAQPYPFELPISESNVSDPEKINQAYLKAVATLIDAKPLLDSAGYSPSIESQAYLILVPPDPSITTAGLWMIPNKAREEPVEFDSIRPLDLIVKKNIFGQPISFKYYDFEKRAYDVPPSQIFPFYLPKDAAEKTSMQIALNSLITIPATNALVNMTGLPAGVTPPVTTLGPGVEKYYDTAKYTTVVPMYRPPFSPPPEVIYGAYPPLSPANFDLTKMTKADAKKFFQDPATDKIYYIVDADDNGALDYRIVTAKEPFISKMTDDIKKVLRGEYAEKQILLTQRSTDQTQFVSSITQRYTTFSDMATNLLKTLVNLYNDLARNLRG